MRHRHGRLLLRVLQLREPREETLPALQHAPFRSGPSPAPGRGLSARPAFRSLSLAPRRPRSFPGRLAGDHPGPRLDAGQIRAISPPRGRYRFSRLLVPDRAARSVSCPPSAGRPQDRSPSGGRAEIIIRPVRSEKPSIRHIRAARSVLCRILDQVAQTAPSLTCPLSVRGARSYRSGTASAFAVFGRAGARSDLSSGWRPDHSCFRVNACRISAA